MPPYPPKLINEGETLVLDLKPHWWFFWKHILAGAIVLIVLILYVGPAGSPSWGKWPIAIGILVYAGFVVEKYFTWSYTHFVLTDRRVISRSGIVSKRGTEIPLERINNINFHQRLIDRIIGAGDLDIESAGKDGQSHFDFIRHPDGVQHEIYRQMETRNMPVAMVQQAPAPAPAPAPGQAVPEQIEQLAKLRDAGHITPAEFEAKKAELLNRM